MGSRFHISRSGVAGEWHRDKGSGLRVEASVFGVQDPGAKHSIN